MTRRLLALALPLLLTLAACGDAAPDPATASDAPAAEAPAPAGATAEADARALANYRLNEQDVERWVEVMQSPEQIGALEDESGADEDVSSLVALIEGNPAYRAAVERAGLTPTRFALISHVVIAAVSAHEAAKAGLDGDSLAQASGIHPANVGFVAEREAELRPVLGM